MNDLMQLASLGLIEIHAEPVGPSAAISDKPRASSLTRYQAMSSDRVTNWVHDSVALDLLPRHVLGACDGNRTTADILEALLTAIADGKLSVADGDQPVQDRGRLEEILRPQIRRIIADFVRLGVLA